MEIWELQCKFFCGCLVIKIMDGIGQRPRKKKLKSFFCVPILLVLEEAEKPMELLVQQLNVVEARL